MVNSYTKWPEIFKCWRPTATTTIHALKKLFSHFGMPKKIVRDNGTLFTESRFRNFCGSLSVEHVTTSSYYPRLHGQAERFVDTFKRALKKNNGLDTEESSIQQFLSVYRITPNPNTISGKSPAELMFSWKIQSVFDRLLRVQKRKKIHSNNKNFKNTKYTPKYFRTRDIYSIVTLYICIFSLYKE